MTASTLTSNAAPITMRPIGRVIGGRTDAIDDDWGPVAAII